MNRLEAINSLRAIDGFVFRAGAFICCVKAREYLRDGRAPEPTSAQVSATMSRIRAKNTKPEQMLRKALSASGIKGYRLHYAKAPGRPDVAFVGKKVAAFVHGCFWHSCPHCQPRQPKSNGAWWRNKLTTNKARDKRKAMALRDAGWKVVTLWECQIRKNPERQVSRVRFWLNT
jgi:DNA mismatch endonuclease, patch repair protein